jgi:hypothetical protein
MTPKSIDYERLGIEACEAFAAGPAAFADFMRTILSVAAPSHAVQTANRDKRREPLNSFTLLSETRH